MARVWRAQGYARIPGKADATLLKVEGDQVVYTLADHSVSAVVSRREVVPGRKPAHVRVSIRLEGLTGGNKAPAISVEVPTKSTQVTNPCYSPETATYFASFWLYYLPLWYRDVISCMAPHLVVPI